MLLASFKMYRVNRWVALDPPMSPGRTIKSFSLGEMLHIVQVRVNLIGLPICPFL